MGIKNNYVSFPEIIKSSLEPFPQYFKAEVHLRACTDFFSEMMTNHYPNGSRSATFMPYFY